ncbi:MAG: hypothetical protein JNL11_00385 [Bdellovibrionaceae bacterium]|nr:hypothetical protein [Pseudobdellovibrionaceae bacterium]
MFTTTKFYSSLVAVLFLLGCSSNSGGGQKPENPGPNLSENMKTKETTDNISPVSDRTPAEEISNINRPNAEDFNILKGMASTQLKIANQFLDQADKLSLTLYETGNEISAEQCAQLEQAVSKNYQFHSYERHSSDKGFHNVNGVKLCPTDSVRNGFYIDSKNATTRVSNKPVVNSAGVLATKVLTVSYLPMFDGIYTTMSEQYLLDSKNRIVEHTQFRSLSKDGSESWSLVASTTKEGHLIGRVYKTRSDMKAPYIWKGASTFVSNDGSVRLGMRVYQNDGKGVEAVKFSLGLPYNITWSNFELSPLARLGGFYKIGNEIINWPKSQLIYDWNKKGSEECGYGYIGYNNNGGTIREFGNIRCEESLDLNKTNH